MSSESPPAAKKPGVIQAFFKTCGTVLLWCLGWMGGRLFLAAGYYWRRRRLLWQYALEYTPNLRPNRFDDLEVRASASDSKTLNAVWDDECWDVKIAAAVHRVRS